MPYAVHGSGVLIGSRGGVQHDETQVPLLPDSRVRMLNAGNELIALLPFVDVECSVDAGAVSDIGCDAGGVDSEIWVGLFASVCCIYHLVPHPSLGTVRNIPARLYRCV